MRASIPFAILLHLATVNLAGAALQPDPHPLFESDAVHEIHLTFQQADWWDQLVYNYENYEDIPYLAAEFDWEAVHFDSIGVRLKGNSSYMAYPGVKKSFKLDIDEYVVGQEIDGLDKLNLNNGFLDASFVREKSCYELCRDLGLPAGRTNFAALYINGDYWGLYTLIEQVDQEFIESRFGESEGGNLWKGEPNGTFDYLGQSEASYYSHYELKTNEEVNDWSDLVEMMDELNNTPISALRDSLHNVMDVNSVLEMLAIDLFTVNLDSYIGRCANYYFYHRDLDDRFVFLKWDMNEAWGLFNMWGYSVTQLQQLDLFWDNPQYNEDRPLAELLWQVPEYQEIYLGHVRRMMDGPAEPDYLVGRMEDLRDLIRPWVYSDPNKMFTNSEFDIAMTSNIYDGPRVIPALETFIRNRDTWLRSQIGEWTPVDGLVLNELMAANTSTLPDNMGDHDDWVELLNTGDTAIELGGLGLTDHHDGGAHFHFPAYSLEPGERVLIWCDEETGEGDWHAPFKLDKDGEDVYLLDEASIIDQISFPSLAADQSWGRWPDGTGDWQLLSVATPGAANDNSTNPEDVVLFVNEFLASNASCGQDETGAYPDWVEIYNPGPDDVEMGGLFLSDDLAVSTKWIFPDTLLGAGEFMLVWCDEDTEDGPLHASFKLSAGGEDIAIFGRLAAGNELIDGYSFGPQATDVSEGRLPDGGGSWGFFETPTPGASNGSTNTAGDTPAARLSLGSYPNPFNPTTRLSFNLPEAGRVRLEIFDISGRLVGLLLDEELEAGRRHVDWRGNDSRDRELASGVYFARILAGGDEQRIRMVLLR